MTADTRLREFIYVDIQRVRSLLASMRGGVTESIGTSTGHEWKGDAAAKLLRIGAGAAYSTATGSTESRSVQDLVFSVFEDAADELGWIGDASTSIWDKGRWNDSSVHHEIAEGQLIRVTADLQMLDGSLLGSECVDSSRWLARSSAWA